MRLFTLAGYFFAHLLILGGSLSAFAEGGGGNRLTVGAGVSAPGGGTAWLENPAGVIYGPGTRVQGIASVGPDQGSPYGFGGLFGAGSDKVAVGLGYLAENAQKDSPGRLRLAQWGLVGQVEAIGTAIGVTGTKVMSRENPPIEDGEVCPNWCVNFGAIVGTGAPFRVGVRATQISESSYLLGGGAAFDLGGALFALDYMANGSVGDSAVTAGVGLESELIQISIGYGMMANGEHRNVLHTGFSMGLGLQLGSSLLIQLHHNRIAQYLATAAFIF